MQLTSPRPFSYETLPATGVVAYFSMEIAIHPAMPTYSGGWSSGRRYAALRRRSGVPLAAFTLLHRKGYFQQRLDGTGMQKEDVQLWDPSSFCIEDSARVTVSVEGRT